MLAAPTHRNETTRLMTEIDKKALSERDVCTKYITPAIVRAGWDLETELVCRETQQAIDYAEVSSVARAPVPAGSSHRNSKRFSTSPRIGVTKT